MQVPPRHAPLRVQRLPSSQGVRSASVVCVQPVAGSQPSVVQVLLSLQLRAGPPTQLPAPSQVSAVVQALPSVQAMVVKPVTGQFPAPSQVVLLVQGLPSSHAVVAEAKVQSRLQQLPGCPLAAPRSHCSLRSTKPLPQSWARRPTTLVN